MQLEGMIQYQQQDPVRLVSHALLIQRQVSYIQQMWEILDQNPKWETKDGTGIPNMESSCDLKTMKYNIVPLSKETTTKDVNERKRIEETKQGRIDGLGNVWYGPIGIAMTRALGDSVMSPAGILPTPQVTRLDYRTAMFHAASATNTTKSTTNITTTTTNNNNNDKITTVHDNTKQKVRILIATDGIFDVMTNEEAVEILCSQLDGNEKDNQQSSSSSSLAVSSSLEDACLHLVMHARKKWQNDLLLDVRVDDATVVVLEFDV
eukprot:CAMPEP_0176495098 /NCGR_PEP_ID=MMETSP0200_2-20121128/10466_1 /TAXON_ID=947934 /ORGANISM="Chaetoceros sp., Strain GSL56" /LENGTH=263 /DNA_ID=CAMNT_0017892935 /DNA_START=31 /DNA_END=822 /DNA_ORIENTATION=+